MGTVRRGLAVAIAVAVASTLVALGWPGAAGAVFREPLGAALNGSHSSVTTAIADVAGAPAVVWIEYNGSTYELHVSTLSGASWAPLGGALDTSANPSWAPSIAGVGGSPEVA